MEQATLVALIGFLVTHIGITIWWASKVNSTIDNFTAKFLTMCDEIKDIKANMFTQKDAERELDIADDAHKALHRRIDRIEERVLK